MESEPTNTQNAESEDDEFEPLVEEVNQKPANSFQRFMTRAKRFAIECLRVWKATKKLDKAELITILKISGLGMAIIGLLGFLIHVVRELLLAA